MSVTYDAGALIAVDRDDPLMFARHRQAVVRGVVPVVPAPVIWQVWRDGAKQARLARFLKSCWVEPVDDDSARDAGVLLGRTGTLDGVDAAVVLSAQRRGGLVYTSDPDDLGLLAGYLGKATFVIHHV
ncbi:MAG: hypothetical protein ACRDTX_22900 [Pseudonocardiaceae bacterium]